MNLFRVMASGKRGINEENMSAVLAWLLHPGMDHGFVPAFLKTFLVEISSYVESGNLEAKKQLQALGEKIQLNLRSNSQNNLEINVELEHNANGRGSIDVLVDASGEWVIGIENKIRATSASDVSQLLKQYTGLCEETEINDLNRQHLVVFLVPTQCGDKVEADLEKSIMAEWNGLPLERLQPKDAKVLVTWRSKEGCPAIERVLTKMLENEANGKIDPFNDQTRHTLLSLRRFITSDFEGYPFDRAPKSSGLNNSTVGVLYLSELQEKTNGFVGIGYGVSWLLRHIKNNSIDTQTFQYATNDMTGEKNWIALNSFIEIVRSAKEGFNYIDEVVACVKGNMDADLICWIAEQSARPVFFVGVRGGSKSLQSMASADIAGKRWAISLNKESPQWVKSDEFATLYRQAEQRQPGLTQV